MENAESDTPNFKTGRRTLEQNAEALWGSASNGRSVRVMVTMPSEAADDPRLVSDLLKGGMDCMRVNCAHDGPEAWGRMVEHLKAAREKTGRSCSVLMDLAGPKLRTGAIQEGPKVIRWKPLRNALGRVIAPAQIWLYPSDAPSPHRPKHVLLPVSGPWLRFLRAGDKVDFTDSRDAKRVLRIVQVEDDGALAECAETAYLVPGIPLIRRIKDGAEGFDTGFVGSLPSKGAAILLRPGDRLRLAKDSSPGHDGRANGPEGDGRMAVVPCTLPEIFSFLKPNERVILDDGLIGARVLSVDDQGAILEVEQARPEGDKLKEEKGVNLPDSALSIPALSPKDLADLEFVARHADMVSLSFAQDAKDVADLQRRLTVLGRGDMGIVLKIETKRGFENLPSMLLKLLAWPRGAVMIARGDLAVECGYERLAEVQEEILWICEAAHVPTIWATQVLESLARTGRPSRSEITDAAMGERAECVMLNKGPHIRAALKTLDDILRRMQEHQRKKSPMLRRLHSWKLRLD
jgi:pyruvate kinase